MDIVRSSSPNPFCLSKIPSFLHACWLPSSPLTFYLSSSWHESFPPLFCTCSISVKIFGLLPVFRDFLDSPSRSMQSRFSFGHFYTHSGFLLSLSGISDRNGVQALQKGLGTPLPVPSLDILLLPSGPKSQMRHLCLSTTTYWTIPLLHDFSLSFCPDLRTLPYLLRLEQWRESNFWSSYASFILHFLLGLVQFSPKYYTSLPSWPTNRWHQFYHWTDTLGENSSFGPPHTPKYPTPPNGFGMKLLCLLPL